MFEEDDNDKPTANIKDHPDDVEIMERWRVGGEEARVACTALGMKPHREGSRRVLPR
jgi:hypothetical protein